MNKFRLYILFIILLCIGFFIAGIKASSLIDPVITGESFTATKMNLIINRLLGVNYNSGSSLIEVNGGIKYGNTSVACDSTSKGVVKLSGSVFYGCNGISWKNFTGASSSSTTQDSYTKFLMHFDGNLIDSSLSNKSSTNYGTTFGSGKSGFGSVAQFDGGTKYFTVPYSADWYFGDSDFTVDFWIKPTSTSTLMTWVVGNRNTGWIVAYYNNSLAFRRSLSSGGSDLNYSYTLQTGVRQHIAFVRSGTLLRAYVDGNQVGTAQTIGTVVDAGTELVVGSANVQGFGGWTSINGELDELRVSKGIARWSGSSFSVPTIPY